MSSFVLKVIAYCSMFCDHLGDALFHHVSFLNYIGRFSFIIFCFQIVQGYIHTHNIRNYFFRLILLAIISQIPFMLFQYKFFGCFGINVIFTLLFGLFVIVIYDRYNKFVGFALCFSLGLIAQICKFDYGFWGVFLVFLFYLCKDNKLYLTIFFIVSVILKYSINSIIYGFPFSYIFKGNPYSLLMYFTCLGILPILFYNGQKGKDVKYLFYIFYPLHLLILSFLN